jgi:hypothetical protein
VIKIYRRPVDHPSAWKKPAVDEKSSVTVTLARAHLEAIDALLERTRSLAPQAVTRADFDHAVLNDLLAGIFEIVQHGRGIVLVNGLSPERYDATDLERIYWGFGTHWGDAVTQSARGDRLGHVTFTPVGPDNPTWRAYRDSGELNTHTDSNEIVGLLCLQSAKAGGSSSFVSSLAVHNEIVAARPDLLAALYEGWFYATTDASLAKDSLTAFKVPVYCCVGETVSCNYNRGFIDFAAELQGGLPDATREALDYFESVCERPDLRLTFLLEPGEMVIWNNFTVLHARTRFEDHDDPQRKRHLLRLWLNVPNGRPVAAAYRKIGPRQQQRA